MEKNIISAHAQPTCSGHLLPRCSPQPHSGPCVFFFYKRYIFRLHNLTLYSRHCLRGLFVSICPLQKHKALLCLRS